MRLYTIVYRYRGQEWATVVEAPDAAEAERAFRREHRHVTVVRVVA